ncbi:MAG: hypothetical protein AB8I08_00375 [Sandaracinaceae bacterium]
MRKDVRVGPRLLGVLLCSMLGGACDEDPPPLDVGPPDAGPTDAGPLFPTCESTEPGALLPPTRSTLLSTVAHAERLTAAGPFNPATERGESRYHTMGLDSVSEGPGVDRVLRDDLGGAVPPTTGRRSLAWFVHYADFQLVDDESPTRLAVADTPAIPSGLRAQEAYLPRALSAMNRTLSELERDERPFDFGIITGDCADSGQANELEWVLAAMNGTPGLNFDSGEDDDPVPGPDNDPKDPFDPVAFPAPWLYVPGNHDVLVTGIALQTEDAMAAALGTRARNGTRDYRQRYAAVTQGEVPADPMRRLVDRSEIVQRLLDDVGDPGPVGHGYAPSPDLSAGANYAYDAVPGVLRVLGLDTNDDTGGSNGLVHRATVDAFLVPELERAATDGVLVVLASHHATSSIDVFRSQLGTEVVPDAVPPEELEQIVAGHPEVIAWLVGHSHDNRIRAVPDESGDHPGYWEIMAPALMDYPGQARLIELVDNADGTLSIFATNVDYRETGCLEQRFRRLMVMEYTSAWTDHVNEDPRHVNVEMLRAIPTSATESLAGAVGSPRIESQTTLRGE